MRSSTSRTAWIVAITAVAAAMTSPGATAQVTLAWAARYDAPGGGWDEAFAMAVDASGNVYVTGTSEGNGTAEDYATVAYDTNGNERWVRRYDGPGNGWDEALAIAVDGSGNVYVTGHSESAGANSDYATVSYDAAGNQRWVSRYDTAVAGEDWAQAIAVDGSGNVYVTGRSDGDTTWIDFATVAYDTNGNQRWVKRYDGPANGEDEASAIAVDGSGNVYVTGYSDGGASWFDYLTVSYDSNGNQRWLKRYDGPAGGDDMASGIALDGSGNPTVTGLVDGGASWNDYATVAYDTNGNQRWAMLYDGPASGDDAASAIAADGPGNVFVTGSSDGGPTLADYATVSYDAAGSERWVRRYDGAAGAWDQAMDIAVDGSGNVVVTGGSDGDATMQDYVTVAYDSGGNESWAMPYNGPASGEDLARAVAVDAAGNVYVTGGSEVTFADWSYATIKITAAAGIDLMRDKSVLILDPLPDKTGYLPMDGADVYMVASPGSKDTETGILSNANFPLVFYQLVSPAPVLSIISSRGDDTVQFFF